LTSSLQITSCTTLPLPLEEDVLLELDEPEPPEELLELVLELDEDVLELLLVLDELELPDEPDGSFGSGSSEPELSLQAANEAIRAAPSSMRADIKRRFGFCAAGSILFNFSFQ
jgi:hypothetical protein